MKHRTRTTRENPKSTKAAPAQAPRERKTESLRQRLAQAAPVIFRKAGCACGGTCPACRKPSEIQTKLNVSQPNDPLELEADRVADQVMRMPLPSAAPTEKAEKQTLMRMPVKDSQREDEPPKIQRMAKGGTTPAASEHHAQVGSGTPLNGGLRGFFEPRFRQDFSGVRIHNDTRAHAMADSLQARAYTLGNHIVFNQGEYRPDTIAGRSLLAHELTHVVQQGGRPKTVQRTVKSALQLIANQRKHIKKVGKKIGIDPVLIARILFQENRNDGNLSRFDDYTWYNDYNFTGIGGPAAKNAGAYLANPFGAGGSVGVGEMRIATARKLLKKYYPGKKWEFYEPWPATYTTEELWDRHINVMIADHDEFAIVMVGLYLLYLSKDKLNQQGKDKSIGPSPETLLKDYNRGLSGHKKGVVSTVGLRSGPYLAEIESALKDGTVPKKPTLKDKYERYEIIINNNLSEHARVYVAFHSERNNESAWYNNDFSSYWDFTPGESATLSYQGETVKSDHIKVKYKTRKKKGDSWGTMIELAANKPGFWVKGSTFTLSLKIK